MSIDMMDEHEQGERVRSWLRENGSAIVGGVALGIAAIAGWQWWGQSQVGHRADAAAQYLALTDAAERSERDTVESMAGSLAKQFADTPYAMLAQLDLAELQVQAGETDAALQTLQDAARSSAEPAFKALIATRVARVQLAAGRAEAALTALDDAKGDAITGIREELRGDALHRLGRREEAITAWQKAYAAYDEGLPVRRLVELKLTGQGGSVAKDEA